MINFTEIDDIRVDGEQIIKAYINGQVVWQKLVESSNVRSGSYQVAKGLYEKRRNK